jgi:hypothetical protein
VSCSLIRSRRAHSPLQLGDLLRRDPDGARLEPRAGRTADRGQWRIIESTTGGNEAFKREHIGGDIVLSSEVTRMPQTTRRRVAKELVKLGLIDIEQIGNGAPVVTGINKRGGATRGVQGATHGAQGATGGV